MAGIRMRRASVGLAALVVLAFVAAGCVTGTASTDNPDAAGCDQWCGNGSATVTVSGTTTTISGGGCYNAGAAGYDIRFGDWQGLEGLSSYLALTAYMAGGPTPPPAPTTNPLAAPTPTGHASPIASGSVAGNPFVLGDDAVVTLNANGTGTFSGTDLDGAGVVTGTYTCN